MLCPCPETGSFTPCIQYKNEGDCGAAQWWLSKLQEGEEEEEEEEQEEEVMELAVLVTLFFSTLRVEGQHEPP